MGILVRSLIVGIVGASAGAAWMVLTYAAKPAVVIELTEQAPPIIRGVYPVERSPEGISYAWTREKVQLDLPGFDRHTPWTLRARVRGGRPSPHPFPELTIATQEGTLATSSTSNAFETIEVEIPALPRPMRGLHLTFTAMPTFVPGPQDPRALGVMIDSIEISPLAGSLVLPPPSALARAALACGLMGMSFGLIGMTSGSAVGAAVIVGLGQAAVASRGSAPYGSFGPLMAQTAFWIGLTMAGLMLLVQSVQQARLRNTALFVAAFSAGALHLELLVLFHPDIDVRDALFQAHRFEWVLSGRYFFTSLAPGNYEFPYAIALYVVTLPWSWLTETTAQYMNLLRTVTGAAAALASACLYPMLLAGGWPRLTGAMAVALAHLVPLSFSVQLVANQTNAFGQSMALFVSAGIVLGLLNRGTEQAMRVPALSTWGPLLLLILLVSVAFLSHTSTFAILSVQLVILAIALRLQSDPSLRPLAWRLASVVIIATVLAWIVYYGRFSDVYAAQFARLSSEVGQPVELSDPGQRTLLDRVRSVPFYLQLNYGWPVVALSAIGTAVMWRHAGRNLLTLTVVSWAIACGAFLIIGIVTPVDMRHYLAAIPLVASLSAIGASTLWESGAVGRSVSAALLLWTSWTAVTEWLAPL